MEKVATTEEEKHFIEVVKTQLRTLEHSKAYFKSGHAKSLREFNSHIRNVKRSLKKAEIGVFPWSKPTLESQAIK